MDPRFTHNGKAKGEHLRIVVIGDIHLYRLRIPARRLIGKRLLGQSNLWLNRRFAFNHDLLHDVIEQTRQLNPDLVLLTGDVTTTSLEDEFADIVEFFEPLAQDVPVVMVPGNHDRYTFASARKKRMESVLQSLIPGHFPHHQRLTDKWHLLALDSAKPQWMLSRGALGRRQLVEAREALGKLNEDEGLLVLCHYPPQVPPGTPRSWAHELADARLLHRMLVQCPAQTLFVHGHIHKPWHWQEPARPGHAPLVYVNAGAPCMLSAQYPLGQGFWQINLPVEGTAHPELVHHVPTPRGNYGTKRPRNGEDPVEPTWHARQVV